jgi:hypothetical protein
MSIDEFPAYARKNWETIREPPSALVLSLPKHLL